MKRISLFALDLREKWDGSEVSSSRVAPVAHVLLVSLTLHERRTMRPAQRLSPEHWRLQQKLHASCGLGGEFDEPKGVEVLVEPFTVHQFGMGAGFHEPPFVENEDTISSLDGRQAMGDHKGRSAFHELLQRLLDESFRLTVKGRGGFIQQ